MVLGPGAVVEAVAGERAAEPAEQTAGRDGQERVVLVQDGRAGDGAFQARQGTGEWSDSLRPQLVSLDGRRRRIG